MTSRPNIIYILADDLGYGDAASYNPDSKIPTPNLDRLASQGMRFTDAHAASAVCTPSRYNLLTGRYCWRGRLKRNVLFEWDRALIEPGRPTVATLLREHGYRTACVGKWHLGWDWRTRDGGYAREPDGGVDVRDVRKRYELGKRIDYAAPLRGGPVDHGFDSYFGIDVPNFPPYTWFEDDQLTDPPTVDKPESMFGAPGLMTPGWTLERMLPELTRRAVQTIEDHAAEPGASRQPLFLYYALTSPHTPICPNEAFIGTSQAGPYGDFVVETDWCVGQILDALDRTGLAEDTLVIFTSDNGPESLRAAAGGTYEHARQFGHYSMAHLRGVKRDLWEGGHRLPFIARWPGITPAAGTCDQLVCLGDLIATCAELLDVELPADAGEDSVSMLPLLHGQTDVPTRRHMVYHGATGHFALRKGRWVFIDAPCGGQWEEPAWFRQERGYEAHDCPGELFDLQDDISERFNRYNDRPETVAALAAILAREQDDDAELATTLS